MNSMENKNMIIALVLSFAILFGWQYLFPTPKQEAPVKASEQQVEMNMDDAAPKPEPKVAAVPEFIPDTARQVTVKTPLYTAVLNSQGGILESFVLNGYKQTIEPDSPNVDLVGKSAKHMAPLGIILNGSPTWSKGEWAFDGSNETLSAEESKTLVFRGKLGNFHLERRIAFTGDSYLIKEEVKVLNGGDANLGWLAFTAATESMSDVDNRYNLTKISYLGPEGLEEEESKDDLEETGLDVTAKLNWGAISSNYFMFALLPESSESTMKGKVQDDIFRVVMGEPTSFDPGQEKTMGCSYYIGPLVQKQLDKAPANLSAAIDFGWFDVLAKPLLWVLNFCYKYVGNYGTAIIILTILIKLLFWPLSQKSYQSMAQMKKLQPMIAKLKEKHGDDKQKLNQETMALYKTYKVNPAGGCLPMVIQIPVFFGLYKALLEAIELRHAAFITHLPFTDMVWLADLSAKDPFYITPLVMGATMFLQQKMSPTAGDPTQAKIMLLMPVVFTFLFLNFPAGLVVYWLVNNVLSIAQQWMMMRQQKA